jgi:RNA polymerase sigma-70 factor (ECF subfamily)
MKLPPDRDKGDDFIIEITRAQGMIAAYVRSLLPTYADYMDVVQEVNVTLWRKRRQYKVGTNFKAWAFQVARYQVLSTRRKLASDGRRLVFDQELVELLADSSELDRDGGDDSLSALRICLGQLREKDRELLRMRYAGRQTVEEYAQQNGRNAGTVRATLRRLREVLLKCVRSKLSRGGEPGFGSLA